MGVVSSRKIERACYEDLAFRGLTGNQQPDHSRISEIRRGNLAAPKGLFLQILRLCQKAGMVSLGHVALDGTKVQANASKHKAMSHERMLRAEKKLEKEINALIRKAEILDAQEDSKYGKGNLGNELLSTEMEANICRNQTTLVYGGDKPLAMSSIMPFCQRRRIGNALAKSSATTATCSRMFNPAHEPATFTPPPDK